MKTSKLLNLMFFAILMVSIISCNDYTSKQKDTIDLESKKIQNEKGFVETIERHLNAVSNRDLASLKSTMSPEGEMQLILPSSEIINSVDSFMDYHEEWFQDTIWTFETKVINTTVRDKMGIAITEIIYREPERDGKPYFNRMTVSYALERLGDKWYIIKDHASSIEKSTDKK